MTAAELYRHLYRIRRVEEEVARVYPTDKIQSPIHLSIGQELASVAVAGEMAPQDKVFGSYRSHALYLAKGGDLKAFVAELYGKATGCAKGKGGSMHLVEAGAGLLGTSAIVGSLIPVATGYAWAQQMKRTGIATAVFFGDGAVEEGCFWESLNFAQLHRVPILFVCENNGYAIHTPIAARQANMMCVRLSRFLPDDHLHGVHGSAPHLLEVAHHVVRSVQAGDGPHFLEIIVERTKEHVGPGEDWSLGYRKRGDADFRRDPVEIAAGHLDPPMRERIESEVEAEVAEAFAFAESSPDPSSIELYRDLYGEERHG